ncbi:MAG: transcriptional regulator [Promethearchaeota archaeon]
MSSFRGGLQYRELRAALKVSDGKLIANLNVLKEMGYLTKSEEQLDRKKLDIYYSTSKGREELEKIIDWVKLLESYVGKGEK